MSLSAVSSGVAPGTIWDDVKIETDPQVLFQNAERYEKDDPIRAKTLYSEAIDRGSVDAVVRLGKMLLCGRLGVPKDENKAVQLFQKAADKGNGDGLALLGKAHYSGLGGLSKDYLEAIRLFREAAVHQSPEGKAYLGWAYFKGRGVSKDYKEAFRLCKEASDQGNANGMYFLGKLMDEGVKKDGTRSHVTIPPERFELWKNAADLGNSNAMIDLVRWAGFPPEDLLKRAIDLGNVKAICLLASVFLTGSGGKREDHAEAFRLFSKAAALGSKDAMEGLSNMREKGQGCQKDQRESHRWKVLNGKTGRLRA